MGHPSDEAYRLPLTIPPQQDLFMQACRKHTIFLEKWVYQGSSGAVYPYPVIDKALG